MNSCIKCGCQEAFPSLPPCPVPAACPNPQPCEEVFDAQCIVFTLPDIECGNDVVVAQDSTTAEAISSIVDYFCGKITTINTSLLIINEHLATIDEEIITINNALSGTVLSVTGLDTDNTDPQNPIVKISVDGTTITGLGTPASPLVATGGGGGSISGSGTTNYIPRWTPNGTTLGDSLIRDNGTSIAVGAAPVANYRFYIETSTQLYGLYAKTSLAGTGNQIGILGTSDGASTGGINAGVVGTASGNSNINVGGSFSAVSATVGANIGIQTQVQSGASNYGAQLRDGTEGIGKMLASVTATGHSNWSKVTSSYTTGASGSFTSVDGKTITVTNGLITSIV
jgi:hypothetical protein